MLRPAERPAVLILGPPGAGKTTLALGLCAQFPPLGHLAPRRFLLDEQRRGTELARNAFAILERQTLLPDEFFVEVAERLSAEGRFQHGLVFEGLPVTVAQAEMLWNAVLGDASFKVMVLRLHLPEAVMFARVESRRTCEACERAGRAASATAPGDWCVSCGLPLGRRPEDSLDRLMARLRAQRAEAALVIRWLAARAVVADIDGELPVHEVLAAATRIVTEAMPDPASMVREIEDRHGGEANEGRRLRKAAG